MGGNLMKRQTAVEWLEQELRKPLFLNVRDAFITAKAMEQRQIIDAHDSGYIDGQGQKSMSAEQYYTETYEQ